MLQDFLSDKKVRTCSFNKVYGTDHHRNCGRCGDILEDGIVYCVGNTYLLSNYEIG